MAPLVALKVPMTADPSLWPLSQESRQDKRKSRPLVCGEIISRLAITIEATHETYTNAKVIVPGSMGTNAANVTDAMSSPITINHQMVSNFKQASLSSLPPQHV